MSANPVTELEAVAYHEGLPGHHMQIAIARELESVAFAVRRVWRLRGWASIPRKGNGIRILIPTLVDWSAKCGAPFDPVVNRHSRDGVVRTAGN